LFPRPIIVVVVVIATGLLSRWFIVIVVISRTLALPRAIIFLIVIATGSESAVAFSHCHWLNSIPEPGIVCHVVHPIQAGSISLQCRKPNMKIQQQRKIIDEESASVSEVAKSAQLR
jgi:hypothetical protein